MIQKLEWDSNFFGYKIGKFTTEDSEKFDELKFKVESSLYKLVYLFSNEKLDFENIKLVDTKLTFIKETKNIHVYECNNIKRFENGKDSFELLQELALMSGLYSRFKLDKNFKKNEYESLYKQWIYNSVYKNKAMDIIIYEENSIILGFTTLEKKTNDLLDISLVAVDENARGKNIGTKLINYTINHGSKRGFNKIQVVTQQNNLPAVNLYKKCGFEIIKKEYIYHYWNL